MLIYSSMVFGCEVKPPRRLMFTGMGRKRQGGWLGAVLVSCTTSMTNTVRVESTLYPSTFCLARLHYTLVSWQ
jgi:hypothetical protein